MWRARREGWASGHKISLLRYTAELHADGAHNGSIARGRLRAQTDCVGSHGTCF
jgi:hypothetical protein